LHVLKKSFLKYLETSPQSNEKLKILHGEIASDIIERIEKLNNIKENIYSVHSYGYGKGKEYTIKGRYTEKRLDITIFKNKNIVAGISVKYPMGNYNQNSNNYFELMLGETANVKCDDFPHFHFFIVPDKIPYFDKEGNIKKWEDFNLNHMKKYENLSNDKTKERLHIPNKVLVYLIDIHNEISRKSKNREELRYYYKENKCELKLSKHKFDFGNIIIYNDYEKYINEIAQMILNI